MRPKSSCTFSAAPSSAAAVPTRCGSKYEEGAARVDAHLHVRATPELRAGVIRGPYSYEYKAHPAAGDDRVRLVQSDGSADLLMSNNRHPSPLSRAASLRSPISPTSTMRRVGWACCMIAMTCRCWCARVRKLPRALSLGCRCRWWTGVLLAGQVGRCVHWGSPRGGDAEEAIRMTIVAQRKEKKYLHGPPTLI